MLLPNFKRDTSILFADIFFIFKDKCACLDSEHMCPSIIASWVNLFVVQILSAAIIHYMHPLMRVYNRPVDSSYIQIQTYMASTNGRNVYIYVT